MSFAASLMNLPLVSSELPVAGSSSTTTAPENKALQNPAASIPASGTHNLEPDSHNRSGKQQQAQEQQQQSYLNSSIATHFAEQSAPVLNIQQVQSQSYHSQPNSFQTPSKQGRPVVSFPGVEWKRLVDREERLTLIGKFSDGRPSLDFLRHEFRSVCPIGGSVQIGSLDSKTILIRFSIEEDCTRALASGRLIFEGKSVRLYRWDPNWKSKMASPLALVWIELPNLPFHLFDADCIARICRPIGRFIELDAATLSKSRPSAAKAKLEVDVSKPLADKIWLEIDGLEYGFWQRILYGKVPKFCVTCSNLGHSQVDCRKRRKLIASEARVPATSPAVSSEDEMPAEEAPEAAVAVETPVVEDTHSTAPEGEDRKMLEPSGIGPKSVDQSDGPLTTTGLQFFRPNGIYTSQAKQIGLVGPAKQNVTHNLKWQRKINSSQTIAQLNAPRISVEGSALPSNTTAAQFFGLQNYGSLNTDTLNANSISAFKAWRTHLMKMEQCLVTAS